MFSRIMCQRKAASLVAAAILVSAAPAAAQSTGSYYGHMGEGWWMGWFLGPVMMLLIVGITIAVVVMVVRWLGDAGGSRTATPRGGRTDPLDILKERFARGEIDKDEFEERRRVLED